MIDRFNGCRRLSPLLAPVACALLSIVPGTAPAQDAPDPPTLQQRMAQEQADTDRVASELPRPEILGDWGRAPADDARALMTDAEILNAYRDGLPKEKPAPEVSQENARAAHALLAEANGLIAGDRVAEAVPVLRQAAKLDPSSPDIWRTFGLALGKQSNAIGAKTALSEAIGRGDDSFEALFAYGRLAARFREDAPAAAALICAASHPDSASDPAARFVLAADLGACLLRLGHSEAGTRHIETILSLPATFDADTNHRDEITEVYRNRRALLLAAAEASCGVGPIDRAARFAEAAAEIPGPIEKNEQAVRCYLLMRTGRPAAAARIILSRFTDDASDQTSVDLLRYITDHSDIGPVIDAELDALLSGLSPEARSRSRQSFALAREAVASKQEERVSVLQEHLMAHPTDRAVLTRFTQIATLANLHQLLAAHPVIEPELSALVLRARPELARGDSGVFAIRSLLRENNFEDAVAAVDRRTERGQFDHAALTLLVETLVDALRGQEADQLLERAAATADDPEEKLAVARALLARGQYRAALRLIEPLIGEESSVAHRLLALNLTVEARDELGETGKATEAAAKAADLDPHNHDAVHYLASSTEAPTDLRRLRDIPGSEPGLAVIQAATATQREQFDLAERLLLGAWEYPLAPDTTAHRLAQLWVTSGASERAERWLGEQVQSYPDRPQLAVRLSRVLSEDRRPEDALETIAASMMSRPGSPALSRELERLLRDDFSAEDRWISQARSRLSNAPRTFATFAERAEIELTAGNLEQAISLAELATDLSPDLRPREQRALSGFLEQASGEMTRRPRLSPDTVSAYERVFDRTSLPSAGAWLGRINIASIREDPDIDELAALAKRAGLAHPEIREEAFFHAARAVLTSSRAGLSVLNEGESQELVLEIYARAVAELDPYPAKVLGEWIEFSQQMHDPHALGEAIRSLGDMPGRDDRRLREAIVYWLTRTSARQNLDANAEIIADAAHNLASQLSLTDQFPSARLLYEEALRAKPDHIETNNSYGYRLLESGEDFDRAFRMIELAYRLSPGEAHITDSMGWARYKQGRFEDETDPQTRRVTPGAVSLLRRAKELALEDDPSGLTAAFTVAHLGDALWASGDRQGAAVEWTQAAVLATRAKRTLEGAPLLLDLQVEIEDLIEASEEKVRAASEDREPPIASHAGQEAPR